ncbi:hypothetical protein KCP75_00190 [Salmonella enterica subsp. enterica]|nr:hypothetical protein KCP75_00190 [Salmonella enterica subsp. enterica]
MTEHRPDAPLPPPLQCFRGSSKLRSCSSALSSGKLRFKRVLATSPGDGIIHRRHIGRHPTRPLKPAMNFAPVS